MSPTGFFQVDSFPVERGHTVIWANHVREQLAVQLSEEASRMLIPELPLTCEAATETQTHLLDDYLDGWRIAQGRHVLLLLGESGTGKTHSLKRFASRSLQQQEATNATANLQIPVFIALGDCSPDHSFMQSLCMACESWIGQTNMTSSAVLDLIRNGTFLLLLDGLDELVHLSDSRRLEAYFRDIIRLGMGRAKIVLTSRQNVFYGVSSLDNLRRATRFHALTSAPHLDCVTILPLDRDIRGSVLDQLTCRFPDELQQLMTTPLLVNLAAYYSGRYAGRTAAGLNDLFEDLVQDWLLRDEWRSYSTYEKRENFCSELAFHLRVRGVNKIPYSQFMEFSTGLMPDLAREPERRRFELDVLTCSFLVSDQDGAISFSHKEIADYLFARRIRDAIGRDDRTAFGQILLRRTDCAFLSHMQIDVSRLRKWLEWTRSEDYRRSAAGCPFLGGNAITLLRALGVELRGQIYDSMVLNHAHLSGADLSKSSFRRSDLTHIDATNARLDDADMTEADLEGFVFDEQGVVHSLAAGRDSAGRTLIAAGMDDGTVIVFRPGISQLHRMVEHYDFVRAMAWHPTSPTLVTGGNDNRVLVWNVDRMALEYRLSTLPACVRSLSFSSNGNLLIGVAWQEGVHVWDFVARQGIRVISVPAVKACIHPAGDRCVVSTIDGRLLVYDLGTGRLVGTLANINAIARALAFSPDGKYLVAGSWDGVVRVWDLSRAPILVAEFSGHADLIDAVAFGPSDGFLLSADWSGRLFTWDIQTTAVIMRVQAHSDIVNGVVSIPAEQWVITASNDARTRVWQATSFELVEDRLLSGHKTTIQCRGTLLRNVRNMQFERLAFLQRRGAVV